MGKAPTYFLPSCALMQTVAPLGEKRLTFILSPTLYEYVCVLVWEHWNYSALLLGPILRFPFSTWPTPISPKMDLCYAQTTIRLPLRFEATLWVCFPCQNSRMIFHFPLPNFPDILLILRYFVAFSADRKHFILISCQASWEKRTNFCW